MTVAPAGTARFNGVKPMFWIVMTKPAAVAFVGALLVGVAVGVPFVVLLGVEFVLVEPPLVP